MLNPLIKRRVTVKKIALLLLAGASPLSTNVAAQEMNVREVEHVQVTVVRVFAAVIL